MNVHGQPTYFAVSPLIPPRWGGASGVASVCANHDRSQFAGGRLGGEGPELVRGEAERRREDDRHRLRSEMPGSAGDEHDQEELIRPERESRDYEGPCALAEDGGIRGAEGPRAVPEIVARSGYEEGDRRRGEVVQ